MSRQSGISDEALAAEYKAVLCYVLSLTGDALEAEDITQETFLRALEAKEQFSGGSSLYTWLCTIAKNQWFSRVKRRNRNAGSEPLEQLEDGSRLEDSLADKSSAMAVMRALHALEDPFKEVFSLRVFGELSFHEIASLFGRTDSWARVTFHRAKEKIISAMRKEGSL